METIIRRQIRVKTHKAQFLLTQIVILTFFLTASTTLAAANFQITLQWNSNTTTNSVAGYKLFQHLEGQDYDYTAPIFEGADGQYTLDLQEGIAYYFVVRAYDADNNISENSNEVRFFQQSSPPETPELINPEEGSTAVALDPILATGPFYDPDSSDYHASTQWRVFRSQEDICVFYLDSSAYLTDFQVPPLILDGLTNYYWTARHINQTGEVSQTVNKAYFTTAPDLDDANQDGIPDYQAVSAEASLSGDTETGINYFKAASGNIDIGLSISDDLSTNSLIAAQAIGSTRMETDESSMVNLPIGLINYKLKVSQPSETTSMTIHLSSAVPENQEWFFYNPDGYSQAQNCIHAPDRKSVTLQLKDGGEGDVDGVANGIIVGLCGYGNRTVEDSENNSDSANLNGSSSGGSDNIAGCFLDTL